MKTSHGLPALVLLALVGGCATSSAPATATGAPSQIASAQVLKLGYREDARPFSFKGADGSASGYSVELCRRVAASLKTQLQLTQLNIQWVPVTAANRIQAVKDGRVDIECGSTSRTLAREQQVDFSNAIWVESSSFIATVSSGMTKVADLNRKRVGVIPGTTTEQVLQRLSARGIEPVYVTMATHTEGIAAVRAGSIDAYATDRLILAGEATSGASSGPPLRLAADDFSLETYGLMMRRDADLRLMVNRALAQTYRSGDIVQIFRDAFSPALPSPLLEATYVLGALPE
ncbi:amino acid ABC transporter substrate-binding protein [Variovorax dokdonensis]|uniref:Amino acid ABC transporter substrate-binding protein n=1 Tax=Variovorax dokdonensis TaxID=344883 RepID=A0ABT7NHH0_9BURK|nr:amino acid ABC transporter substrate-binding protein [Variovorax dokdonensis]MDM0047376.1 amino acid ABC transporter substrate-binding protein [Variovorax dokdonensis]